MKKSIFIIGIFILGCILCTTVYAEALSATLSLTPSATSVKKGETFTVAVSVNNVKGDNGWQSFDGNIAYDSMFEMVKFDKNGSLSEMSANSNINLMSATNIKSNMQVGTITFKVKSDASETSGTVELKNAEIVNLQGETAPLSGNKVTITVPSAEPAPAEEPDLEVYEDDPIEDVIGAKVTSETGNEEAKTSDTATKILPKTGIEVIAIVAVIGVLTIGVLALIKYKNVLK